MSKMLFVAAAFPAAFAIAAMASPQAGDWDILAVTTVKAGSSSDQLGIRSYEQYNWLRICSSAPIRLRDLRIGFYNGDRQEVALGAAVPGGSCSSAIDLKGVQRNIEKVRVRYDPTGQATVQVQAR